MNLIKKPSQITALLGLASMILSLIIFITNVYFSNEPNSVRAENLIDTIYMFSTSALFFLIATYFDCTGR